MTSRAVRHRLRNCLPAHNRHFEPVSVKHEPVSAIDSHEIRIFKIGMQRFTGETSHFARVRRPDPPQRPNSCLLTLGKLASLLLRSIPAQETGLVGWRRSGIRTRLRHEFTANMEFNREYRDFGLGMEIFLARSNCGAAISYEIP